MEKFLIVGNWKMNGLSGSVAELERVVAHLDGARGIMLCPPTTLLAAFLERARGTAVKIGAQTCHAAESGAHTGDIAAEMLAELGVAAVICGHSERRAAHGETDAQVKAQSEAVQRAAMLPIICIGETQEERGRGKTLAVLERQLSGSVPESGDYAIAYEPIWAIGGAIAAEPSDIEKAHRHILSLVSARVLYGGSVKPDNVAAIAALEGVGGLLIGNASLKAESFLSIIDACRPFY